MVALSRFRPAVEPGRLAVWPLLIAGLLWAGFLSGETALAQSGDDLDRPSPAGIPAVVAAQGVAELPAPEIAWRISGLVPDPLGEAAYDVRALGFAVSVNGSLLLTNNESGDQLRLAAGEAAFVPAGVRQRREALDPEALRYAELALVPADETDSEGDLLLLSDPFAAPAGRRDLDLVQAKLSRDQVTTLLDTGYPTAILATTGQIEVAGVEGEPVVLDGGGAVALSGNLTIRSRSDEQATFVAAVLGPELPAAAPPIVPASPPTDRPAPLGSISLQIAGCPASIQLADLHEACLPLYLDNDGDPATGQRTLDGATPLQNAVGWSGLPLGEWTLAVETGRISSLSSATDADALGTPIANTATVYPIRLTAQNPDVLVQIVVAPPPAPAAGDVVLHVYQCPPDIEAMSASPERCSPAPHLTPLLSGPHGDELGLHDEQGTWAWRDLVDGAYTIALAGNDRDDYLVPALPGEAGSGYALTLDAAHRRYDLTLYDLPYPEPEPTVTDDHAAGDGTDEDGDRLDAATEGFYGTDPNRADSDGDGLSDGSEIASGTDPMRAEPDDDPATDEPLDPHDEPPADTAPQAGDSDATDPPSEAPPAEEPASTSSDEAAPPSEEAPPAEPSGENEPSAETDPSTGDDSAG